jgi:hypothetical protein
MAKVTREPMLLREARETLEQLEERLAGFPVEPDAWKTLVQTPRHQIPNDPIIEDEIGS